MKTDSLFYGLFKLHPESLFELVNLKAEGKYGFESITVKTAEKRLDGFFMRKDGEGPYIFLEVQGYDDPDIYWRLFREIFAYYEKREIKPPFVAIVLFTDKKFDPGDCPVSVFAHPHRFIRGYLPDCLETIRNKASALTVLKPLVFSDKEKLPEAVPQWKAEIDALNLSEDRNMALIELLEQAIISRFPKLTHEEVLKMIQLTPIEETVVGKELIQMGILQGWKDGVKDGWKDGLIEGVEKGELIGKIHATQRFSNRRLTPKQKLLQKSIKELRATLKKLETELKSREYR